VACEVLRCGSSLVESSGRFDLFGLLAAAFE
jgi:hypothetical protein